MNYFIDVIPVDSFIRELAALRDGHPDDAFTANLYVRELPSMHIMPDLYLTAAEAAGTRDILRNQGWRVNVMMDTFCFGNREFDAGYSRRILRILDMLLTGGADYATVTNYFFFRCIRQRYPNITAIFSEYAEISNVQKIARYLLDFESGGVKIDTALVKNRKTAAYIKGRFPAGKIHVTLNAGGVENNVYKDTLNNNIAHFLQKEKWDEARALLRDFRTDCSDFEKRLISLDSDDHSFLVNTGYHNFWIYRTAGNAERYLNNVHAILAGNLDGIDLYPWSLIE